MKNWNVDAKYFKSPQIKRAWKLTQLINYGLNGQKLSEVELKKYWPQIKSEIDAERARMLEYLLWNKVYSLKNRKNFWSLSPKTNS